MTPRQLKTRYAVHTPGWIEIVTTVSGSMPITLIIGTYGEVSQCVLEPGELEFRWRIGKAKQHSERYELCVELLYSLHSTFQYIT